MKVVNLTPHKIDLYNEDKEFVMGIEPSGTITRIVTHYMKIDEVSNVPLFLSNRMSVSNMPPVIEGTIYIVSNLVFEWAFRHDLWTIGEPIRDEDGRIIGAIGLSQ